MKVVLHTILRFLWGYPKFGCDELAGPYNVSSLVRVRLPGGLLVQAAYHPQEPVSHVLELVASLAAPSTHAVCHFREVAAGAPTKHGRRCVDALGRKLRGAPRWAFF